MDYINLGILAHVDAGKTTIVEQLLYRSGVLRAPGSVEKGNTQTDWLSVERERGISVRSSSVSLDHNGIRINLIDTPGHFDFTGETERALGVLDAAVLVVSAAEGIQSQTEIFWNALKTLRIPVLLFVNKIDRMGCDPAAVLDALKSEFSEAIFPLNAAVSPGSRECGARPSVFTDDDILALCERDAQLAGQYLSGDGGGMNGGEGADEGDGGANGGADADEGDGGANGGDQVVSRGQLTAALARLSKRAAAYPLLFGSAALGLGMSELLDAVTEYLPAANAAPDGDLLGIIYKIEHDRAMGKIAHVRLFTGTLRNRDTVWLERAGGAAGTGSGALPSGAARAGGGARPGAPTAGIEEKVTQIKRITGARREDTGVLCGGDIAAIYGLAGARTGDILRTPG
ncbi:MAG: GTP-binding protein, partial [Clostridiales bacterium]|nr:GTP-binding protein [Clostridiales bacterium]